MKWVEWDMGRGGHQVDPHAAPHGPLICLWSRSVLEGPQDPKPHWVGPLPVSWAQQVRSGGGLGAQRPDRCPKRAPMTKAIPGRGGQWATGQWTTAVGGGGGIVGHCKGERGALEAVGRDAVEGNAPQRQPRSSWIGGWRRLPKRFGGGYCRLKTPLKLAFAVRETVAGAPWRGPPPPSSSSLVVGA